MSHLIRPDDTSAGLTPDVEAVETPCLILLADEQWNEFQAVLDRPVQGKPQLLDLLKKPGIFDLPEAGNG